MIVLGYNGFTRSAQVFAEHFGSVGIDRHNVTGHDAGASLLVDGELVAAVEEERLNREKKTSGFPLQSVRWCLAHAGVRFSDIDLIAIPWNFSDEIFDMVMAGIVSAPMKPVQKLDLIHRLGEMHTKVGSHEAILEDFATRTGFTPDPEKVVLVQHHLAHATTGYYVAGMKDAAFLISDGRAEIFSSIMGEFRDGKIQVFEGSMIPGFDSIGLLFSSITRYLGFVPNMDEYKVMGLSGYAKPPSPNPFLEHFVRLQDNGRYRITVPQDINDNHYFDPLLQEHFGPFQDTLEYKANMASAAQEMLTAVTSHQLRAIEAKTDLDQLLFEGGVALNCSNNTKLLEGSRFTDIHVSFGASDTGIAIGAAVHAWANHPANAGQPRTPSPVTPYLGPEYDSDATERTLHDYRDQVTWQRLTDEEIVTQVAELLTGKVIIGWHQGRIEHGPRALGHRSILANPCYPDIKDIINTRVKHREPFRPFAPIVLEADAPKIFDMGRKTSSPYMTFVFPVRPEYRDIIPGATHVDGTSRIQTITDRDTPLLAALLRQFTVLTDVPCLINTSFNVAGEPIVCTPADALNCFLSTEIDYLIIGNYLITKTSS
jgi:carbamoyltransferase